MDATLIVYTGLPLSYIPVAPGDNLETILIAINTAINSSSSAPNLSGYNLYCLRDGCTINTLQDFAECISSYVCDLSDSFDDYVTSNDAAISSLVVALTNLQMPALTYAPFGIVDTDSLPVVYSKMFAGFDTMIAESDPSGADWASLSVSPPTTVADACDVFISIFTSLEPTLASLADLLPLNGPYNNSANCLTLGGGAADDNADDTIRLLTQYVCTLPAYDSSAITTSCLFSTGTLQGDIQLFYSFYDTYIPLTVGTWGDGLLFTPGSGCSPAELDIDTSWPGLYKVMAHGADAVGDFLINKVTTVNSTMDIHIFGDKVSFDVAPAITAKLGRVNASGADLTDAGYLIDKVVGGSNDWGISILTTLNGDNSKVVLTPVISDRKTFISNWMSNVLDDEDLLAQWCALRDACNGCLCGTVGDLLASKTGYGQFDLLWTPAGGTTTAQISKYRSRDMSSWLTGLFSPVNPLDPIATTTSIAGLLTNVVYQFQVDSDCPGDVGHSNIAEAISYKCTPVEWAIADAGGGFFQITATLQPLATIDNVQFRLVEVSGPTTVENIITTGVNPIAAFAAVSTGTYRIQWRYATLIDGVTLYSDNVSQVGEYCDNGSDIVIP